MIALAFLFYAALSGLFLTLALPDWTTHILGGLQDTRLFLWNAWWFKDAVAQGLNPYHTPMLFHPFGVSLLSHDYPLWNNILSWLFQNVGAGIPLAVNLTFLLTWTLNGFCSFLLAREVLQAKDRTYTFFALVAGVYVMTHSYTQARMVQNWGQFNLFGIPLFLWLLVRLRRTRHLPDAVWAGAALAFNAACHYYFLIYSAAIWLGWLLFILLRPAMSATPKPNRKKKVLWLSLAALGAGLAFWIHVARPGGITLAGHFISLTTPVNALLVMWVALAGFLTTFFRVRFSPHISAFTRRNAVEQGIVILSTAFFLLPLILSTLHVITQGDYPKQHILWKTHLNGANLLALFYPNPSHVLWGESFSHWLDVRGIQPQEQAAAIGWACLVFVVLGFKQGLESLSRRWLFLAGSATVLSMGAYLHIDLFKTWMPLPFYLWRLLPVLGNVRVPERWMAVGSVAWGVVLALALAALARRHPLWGRRLGLAALLLILAENWPGVRGVPLPAEEPVVEALRALPPGGVLVLPFYAGDSSIGIGNSNSFRLRLPWDHLWAQTFHHKPMVGGYIGRVPRRLLNLYKEDPLTRRLVDLEEGSETPTPLTPRQACESATSLRFSYVLVYPSAVPGGAWEDLQKNLPLKPLKIQDDAGLFIVENFTCSKLIEK